MSAKSVDQQSVPCTCWLTQQDMSQGFYSSQYFKIYCTSSDHPMCFKCLTFRKNTNQYILTYESTSRIQSHSVPLWRLQSHPKTIVFDLKYHPKQRWLDPNSIFVSALWPLWYLSRSWKISPDFGVLKISWTRSGFVHFIPSMDWSQGDVSG